MLRDPDMFPEPETFRPERFLETDDARLDDFSLHFGFGRRHCVGMHVAQQSVYITISRCAARSLICSHSPLCLLFLHILSSYRLMLIWHNPGPGDADG